MALRHVDFVDEGTIITIDGAGAVFLEAQRELINVCGDGCCYDYSDRWEVKYQTLDGDWNWTWVEDGMVDVLD